MLFGISFVNSGSTTNLKNLKPIYNAGIREASSVFRSSPVESIMAESGQLPFEHPVILHIVSKAVRLSEKTNIPFRQRGSNFLSIQRGLNSFQTLKAKSIPAIAPLARVGDRNWNISAPQIDWTIKNRNKVGESSLKAKQIFLTLCETKYKFYRHIFTDGSVNTDNVGFGVAYENSFHSKLLPNICSIFSAEAMAILYAVTTVCHNTSENIIFTDSASVLSALEKGRSRHPWIQEIENAIGGKPIVFCWIPGHVGIVGNEKADALAKAGNETLDCQEIPSEDVIRYCKRQIREHWENKWRSSTTFLRSIKSNSFAWTDRHSATERRAISRLRIGHTRITHQHLFNRESGYCRTCGEQLTVPHLLLDCRAYDAERTQCNLKTTIGDILSNELEEERKLAKFLRVTKLIEKI